ncbi:hypothetical protein M231_02510 [Tremella mesenterica]|uniref:Uncharacterized protein n=2 Tax=Tremella mesenterica TaxID=5217 RepID=A0A4Q1BQM2_TREME|nr:hypothetical protein M231_02510 [Tremella mesenterica]
MRPTPALIPRLTPSLAKLPLNLGIQQPSTGSNVVAGSKGSFRGWFRTNVDSRISNQSTTLSLPLSQTQIQTPTHTQSITSKTKSKTSSVPAPTLAWCDFLSIV